MPADEKADRVFVLCQTGTEHETVLHALNRWLPYEEHGTQVYLDSQFFKGTESQWNQVPAIFAPRHPDPDKIREGRLQEALDEVGGRVCGSHSNATVYERGQPRLAIKTNFTDPEVQALYDEGKIAVSSGMRATFSPLTGRMSERVVPNHVLYFVPSDSFLPRDPSAMLLNAREVTPMNDDKTILETMKAGFENIAAMLTNTKTPKPPAGDGAMNEEKVTDLMNQIEGLKKSFADTNTAKDQQIADLKNQIEALTPTLDQIKNSAADIEWNGVKSTLPTGVLHGEGREDALRKLYTDDPRAFIADVLPKMKVNLENAMRREGDRIVMSDSDIAAMATDVEKAKAETGRR